MYYYPENHNCASRCVIDVHETADGHLVCIHDHAIDRTTNGSGAVDTFTLKEIQEYDAGQGQKVPSLEDVLKFSKGKIGVNIELKLVGLEQQVASLLSRMNIIDDVVVSSFLHLSLSEIKEIDDRIKIAILFQTEIDDLSSYAHEMGAYAINPMKELVSDQMVIDAHHSNVRVYPWTVNEEETMIQLFSRGVDGIITDHPEIGIRIVQTGFSQ
ncbi:MAG: glycerophosphodiester phosphodiesterase [Candidatus Thorarchaeota archaeon]